MRTFIVRYYVRAYCIRAELTNSNVLGKLTIREQLGNSKITVGGFGKNTMHT